MFVSGVDTTATETKGTVLIHSAEQVSKIILSICHLDLSFDLIYIYKVVRIVIPPRIGRGAGIINHRIVTGL